MLPTAVSSLTHSDGNTPASNDKLLAQLARSFAEHIPDRAIEEGGPKLEAAIRFEIQLQEALGRTRPFGRRPNPRRFTVRGGRYRLRQEHGVAHNSSRDTYDREVRRRHRDALYDLNNIAESLESDITPQYDEIDWLLEDLLSPDDDWDGNDVPSCSIIPPIDGFRSYHGSLDDDWDDPDGVGYWDDDLF